MILPNVEKFTNVRATTFGGLLVDFAPRPEGRRHHPGLRALSDFEFEFNMALMNRHLRPGIETIFVMPNEQFSYTSCSLVKQVARYGGQVGSFRAGERGRRPAQCLWEVRMAGPRAHWLCLALLAGLAPAAWAAPLDDGRRALPAEEVRRGRGRPGTARCRRASERRRGLLPRGMSHLRRGGPDSSRLRAPLAGKGQPASPGQRRIPRGTTRGVTLLMADRDSSFPARHGGPQCHAARR